MELTESLENYIKEIYEIMEIKNSVRVIDLINFTNLSPGSISRALDKLEKMGLIIRNSKGITFTNEGLKIAERLIKANRLSERFLTDILQVDWIRAHILAHKLEHVWPEDVLERINTILNRPKYCPHGHPIPGNNGKIEGIPLDQAEINKEYEVSMIGIEDEWFLLIIDKLGLKLNERLKIVDKSNEWVIIASNNSLNKIENNIAKWVFVKSLNS
ncbi:MAG: metal-dependent transcriptional regulator [Sulfolobaceae archaeon]|nr:metal-dependent transcriptional regulator [Sulfolobaceae archaeon]